MFTNMYAETHLTQEEKMSYADESGTWNPLTVEEFYK
jgi:hypothetical protein